MPTTEKGRPRPAKMKRMAHTPPEVPSRVDMRLLSREDIRKMLLELADRIAPGDVTELLGHEKQLRRRIAGIDSPHLSLFRDQLVLALDCLRDHARGRCPQIPYFTISLLAGALWYFVDELDAVPDFLPGVGQLDDAVMVAMAFQLGEDGLRRYCVWKSRPADSLFGAAAALRLRETAPHPSGRRSRRPV
jgi:uncharacterized membrane protein YkvA (DUF1232 family)